jgi:hypothetical protein
MTGTPPGPEVPPVGAVPATEAPPVIGPAGRGPSGGPGAARSRAQAFRHEHALRQTHRTYRTTNVVLVALIVVGAYAIVTEHPGHLVSTLRSLEATPGPGPPIVVTFGTPTESTVNCTGGGTAAVESIPWNRSTETLATGEVLVRLYEIWDGDNIADPGAVANATPSNLCAGTPPNPSALWYIVFAAPNGTNLLTYTEANSWSSVVAGGSSDLKIYDGSNLVVVSYDSLANTGRGLELVGFVGDSQITGSVPL